MGKIFQKIADYVDRKRDQALLSEHGCVNRCPYCLQPMCSEGKPVIVEEHPELPTIDILTCRRCDGKSLWRFEIGFFFFGPYEPPPCHFQSQYQKDLAVELKKPLSLPEEGAPCPEWGCDGVLEYEPLEGCTCFINPPCSACVSLRLTCPSCHWLQED